MKLRTKIPAVFTALIFVFAGLSVLIAMILMNKQLSVDNERHYKVLAHTLALSSADAIVLKDYAAMRNIVDRVAEPEHMAYAIILDENGMVLADSRHDQEGMILKDPASLKAASATDVFAQETGPDITDVAAPLVIAGAKWGVVRIGYSRSTMMAHIAITKLIIILIGLLSALIGGAFSFYIAKRLTRSLEILRKGTEVISGGNFDHRLELSTGDEIEEVAGSFNSMSVQIQKQFMEIKRSSSEWEQTLNAVSAPIFTHDKDFRILRCNEAYEKAAGCQCGTAVGRLYYELFPKADGPAKGCLNARLMHENGDEKVFIPETGSTYNAKYYLINDVNGAYLYSLHIMDDITEKEKAVTAFAAQALMLETFFENALVGVAIMDREFNFIRVNHAYASFDHRKPSDFPGHNHFEFYPSDAKAIFEQVVATKQPYETAARAFSFADHPERGVTFWDWNLVPILDDDGEVGKLIFTLRDVTDRVRADTELRKISETVEQNPASILITDTAGRIEYVNPRLLQTTGYTKEEVMGMNPRIFNSGETPFEKYREMWKTIASGKAWHGEFHNKKKNGELFWEAATIAPIMGIEGNIKHYFAIKYDITEKKKTEEQLQHAQKLESLGTLAGGIAHDFNNMLNIIVGYGGIMEMNMPRDSPHLPHLKEILAAADRAAKLAQGLLIFSRKQVVEPRPVNVNDIIDGMKKMIFRIIGEDIESRLTLTADSLITLGDYGQLEQVLMNLATNARDAMPDGGLLTITTEQYIMDRDFIHIHGFGKPGKYALISVSDTGAGMDASTREKIFEPYFTTKAPGKGTGLGLSIVYGIIKQHNGFINCYSEPGEGTIFRIYLPLIHESFVVEQELEEASPIQGGTETILLADDDAAIRKMTRELLEKFGYAVIEAGNGEEAVKKFEECKDNIKLLLLDVIMPTKSGKAAFEEIRKLQPDIKVLFISGYTDDILQRQKIQEDNLHLIIKPVKPPDLLANIRKLLDSQGS